MKTNGPGVYDDLCTQAREAAEARNCVLIIFDGNRGSGFSVQCEMDRLAALPAMLEIMAKQIRADIKESAN